MGLCSLYSPCLFPPLTIKREKWPSPPLAPGLCFVPAPFATQPRSWPRKPKQQPTLLSASPNRSLLLLAFSGTPLKTLLHWYLTISTTTTTTTTTRSKLQSSVGNHFSSFHWFFLYLPVLQIPCWDELLRGVSAAAAHRNIFRPSDFDACCFSPQFLLALPRYSWKIMLIGWSC